MTTGISIDPYFLKCYFSFFAGGMAERSKAAVLKTVSRKRDVGSNPTPSASIIENYTLSNKLHSGEMAELAEGARLLSECGAKVPPRVRIPLSPPETPNARH